MLTTVAQPQPALKFEVEVQERGHVELTVPFAPGARVTIFVIEDRDDPVGDLLAAAESSLAFWDNPYDDEDWNNA